MGATQIDISKLTPEQIQALLDENAQLKADKDNLQGELETAATTIEQQAQQLSDAEASVAASPAIFLTHEGAKYQVMVRQLQPKGSTEVIKAADLSKHPEVVARLVARGSHALQKVVKKK